jgi:hypothetical protein
MDKVQNPSNSEFYTSRSEPFRNRLPLCSLPLATECRITAKSIRRTDTVSTRLFPTESAITLFSINYWHLIKIVKGHFEKINNLFLRRIWRAPTFGVRMFILGTDLRRMNCQMRNINKLRPKAQANVRPSVHPSITRTHTNTHTHAHTHEHARTHAHEHTNTWTHEHINTHTNTHKRKPTLRVRGGTAQNT